MHELYMEGGIGDLLKKINFFVDEDIRKELEAMVTAGQKSKVINDALRKELLRIKREKATEKLLEYEFKERPIIQEIINLTLGLMTEYKGITFYDGVYHALAIHENGFMVTADSAYFERVKEKGRILLI